MLILFTTVAWTYLYQKYETGTPADNSTSTLYSTVQQEIIHRYKQKGIALSQNLHQC